ncbi:hypothetical protein HELRODRAFT_172725 [Helobdella robusta]|uniref:CCHC-type domain-containing protein n=1 Tax=Helobdella robusta TaxID=6412 RepID=T1F5V0_HELRO|nr:hypothetical protein HELRODRAFT_172725 [Helobdella robusta]ESO04358.1 hypothetical protein HELRODRAFT_172725 [Helobdella robusta]
MVDRQLRSRTGMSEPEEGVNVTDPVQMMQLRKLELEMQILKEAADQDRQIKKEAAEREKEKVERQLELEEEDKKLRREAELPAYFQRIEGMFDSYEITEDIRAELLVANMETKMKTVLNELKGEDYQNYEAIKQRIIYSCRFSPMKLRDEFYLARKKSDETFPAFAAKLHSHLRFYFQSRGIENLDRAMSLLVVDRMKELLPKVLLEHVLTQEGESWLQHEQMADVLETFEANMNMRSSTAAVSDYRLHHLSEQRGKHSPWPLKDDKRGPISKVGCYKCGNVGHLAKFCTRRSSLGKPVRKIMKCHVSSASRGLNSHDNGAIQADKYFTRPFVDVQIQSGPVCKALVDSGAEVCGISQDLCQRLKLPRMEKMRIRGWNGQPTEVDGTWVMLLPSSKEGESIAPAIRVWCAVVPNAVELLNISEPYTMPAMRAGTLVGDLPVMSEHDESLKYYDVEDPGLKCQGRCGRRGVGQVGDIIRKLDDNNSNVNKFVYDNNNGVGNSDVGNVGRSDVRGAGKSYGGNVGRSDVGGVGKSDVGNIGRSDVRGAGKSYGDVRGTGKSYGGNVGRSDVGGVGKSDVGNVGRLEVGRAGKSDVGGTRRSDVGGICKSDVAEVNNSTAATKRSENDRPNEDDGEDEGGGAEDDDMIDELAVEEDNPIKFNNCKVGVMEAEDGQPEEEGEDDHDRGDGDDDGREFSDDNKVGIVAGHNKVLDKDDEGEAQVDEDEGSCGLEKDRHLKNQTYRNEKKPREITLVHRVVRRPSLQQHSHTPVTQQQGSDYMKKYTHLLSFNQPGKAFIPRCTRNNLNVTPHDRSQTSKIHSKLIETWITSDDPDVTKCKVAPPGFSVIHQHRVHIFIIYRPPGPITSEFLNEFNNLSEGIISINIRFIICGDFNAPFPQAPVNAEWLEIIDEFNLLQHVTFRNIKKVNWLKFNDDLLSSSILEYDKQTTHQYASHINSIVSKTLEKHAPLKTRVCLKNHISNDARNAKRYRRKMRNLNRLLHKNSNEPCLNNSGTSSLVNDFNNYFINKINNIHKNIAQQLLVSSDDKSLVRKIEKLNYKLNNAEKAVIFINNCIYDTCMLSRNVTSVISNAIMCVKKLRFTQIILFCRHV